MKTNIRHGDVILVPATLPDDAEEQMASTTHTLAEGEVTGHSHRLVCDMPVPLLIKGARKFYRIPKKATAELLHEEHCKGLVLPGIHELIIQREYDDEEEWRNVCD